MGIVRENVKFTDPCESCQQSLREFYEPIIWDGQHTMRWQRESHTIRDCIKHLVERLERLENA